MYSLEIEIPIAPTDSNQILGVNKFKKHAIFKRIKRDVAILVHKKIPKEPLKKFHISIARHSIKPLDYDNYIASLKPFIDGLVLSKVIQDDSWEFIKFIDVEQTKSKERKLVIKVVGV